MREYACCLSSAVSTVCYMVSRWHQPDSGLTTSDLMDMQLVGNAGIGVCMANGVDQVRCM